MRCRSRPSCSPTSRRAITASSTDLGLPWRRRSPALAPSPARAGPLPRAPAREHPHRLPSHVPPQGLRPRRARTRRGHPQVPQVRDEALARGTGAADSVPPPAPLDCIAAHDGGREPGRRAAHHASQRPAHHDGGLRPPRARLPARRDRSPRVRGDAHQPHAASGRRVRGATGNPPSSPLVIPEFAAPLLHTRGSRDREPSDDSEKGPRFRCLTWSGRQDLNLRHSAPKADALPGCATPRGGHILHRAGFEGTCGAAILGGTESKTREPEHAFRASIYVCFGTVSASRP